MTTGPGPHEEVPAGGPQYPQLRVVGGGPTRALRRGMLIVGVLMVALIVKPWGDAQAPAPIRPESRPVALATASPRPTEHPIAAICHDSPSWRVASVGLFLGATFHELGYVTPVSAVGPGDPSIPFVLFIFDAVPALGYCAPPQEQVPTDLRVFRLDENGFGTLLAVTRSGRTPESTVGGLFSPTSDAASRGVTPTATSRDEPSWPPGRYVFAVGANASADRWFGVVLRPLRTG